MSNVVSKIREEHMSRLPTVRIQQAVLQNVKSVEYGEILFNCGKQAVPCGTRSDILGLYGQNGSGKTAFIEALAILKRLMAGSSVPGEYAESITKDKTQAKLKFTFDLQYPNGDKRTVNYEVNLAAVENDAYHIDEVDAESFEGIYPYQVKIFDEIISIGGDIDGKKTKMQPVIDSTTIDTSFGPLSKRDNFIGKKLDVLNKLDVSKKLASERSQSFIFSNDLMNIFQENSDYYVYYQVLLELRHFARYFLFVLDMRTTGFNSIGYGLLIHTRSGQKLFKFRGLNIISEEKWDEQSNIIDSISIVLGQLVPGLSIMMKKIGPAISKSGKPAHSAELVAKRGDMELPIRYESDGIRRIISTLNLIISAYNKKSMTIAIDEFDAGVFEYLLGEILQSFEESGKGQFIFTSHNLRPLEVLSKEFLCFTTTNPKNRYARLKFIGKTNNLRSVYYREIILGEQQEEFYSRTKRFKIIAAFRKAGAEYAGGEA